MKKQYSNKNDKPVTIVQLKKILKQEFTPIHRRFDAIDKRFEQTDKRFEQTDKRFKSIDKRFEEINQQFARANANFEDIARQFINIDQNFAVLNGKFAALTSITTLNIDRAIHDLEERLDKKFDKLFAKMDSFLKRTEVNERESLFLGNQHNDLAKYCTEKIAYPAYGRKL